MKYLKLKPFKELQAAESGIESDYDKLDSIETCLAGVKRHVSNDNCIDIYDSDDNKKVKMDPDIYIQKEPEGRVEKRLSSVQILGHDLQYKLQSTNVMFSNTSVMDLLSSSYQLHSASPHKNKKAFISWTDLKNLLKGGLLDLAIKEALTNQCEEGDDKAQDCVPINEEMINFKVKNGVVYLEVRGAFSALGRLEEVVTNNWIRVDSALSSAGLSPRSAFKGRADGVNRNRNFINLQAFSLLAETIKTRTRVDRLNQIVDNIRSKERKISQEFQQTVDMILRMSCLITPKTTLSESSGDIIDLSSSSESEGNVKDSSSGIESEDFSPPAQRKPRLSSTIFDDSDDDTEVSDNAQFQNINDEFVELLGVQIPIHIRNEMIYIEKVGLVKILGSTLGFLKNGLKGMEKLLTTEGFCLDEAILHKGIGRQKLFLSLSALQKLISSQYTTDLEEKRNILDELEKIKTNFEIEKSQLLSLKTFESIKYKVVNGTLFIDCLKLLEMSGFSPSYFHHAPAKAKLLLCKILTERGVNTSNCFMRYGKSKYAFISISAATVLLRSDICYLKDIEKATRLLEEIHQALDCQNILRGGVEKKEGLTVLECSPDIRYKLLNGKLFLHRKSTFECLQLEESLLSSKKGYQSLNNILKLNGLDLAQCYLPSKYHNYSYISISALLHLLQSQDPLIVCLANKDRFLLGLLNILQQAAIETIFLDSETDTTRPHLYFNDEPLVIKCMDGRIYFDKASVFQMSGLAEKEAVLDWPADMTALLTEKGLDQDSAVVDGSWLSLHYLYLLLSQASNQLTSSKVTSRDILSAVALYEPRVRIKIGIEKLKSQLIVQLEKLFVEKCSQSSDLGGGETDWSPPSQAEQKNFQTSNVEHNPLVWPVSSSADSQTSHSSGKCIISSTKFEELRRDILAAAQTLGEEDMFIGDWKLEQLEGDLKMTVKPGYGASKKISFLKPDFAAILRYCLVLSNNWIKLTINEKIVDSKVVGNIMEKTEKEGTLSFLCQLISLRPCFGNFSPELVETAAQAMSRQDSQKQLSHIRVDNSFVGTSSCGRTYAGTVRHEDCCILAIDRVSDVCRKCQELSKLTINRSLLSQEDDEKTKPGQKSVWKLATTSSDCCCFICPQIQSFNTSLPHAFNGLAQANSVVSHSVQISNNLEVKVHLSDRLVCQEFPEFQKTRHLGPLLDWVANLRLCVGYPSQSLVTQAKFIIENGERIGPEMRKFFRHLTVDDKFEYKMSGDGSSLSGTIRSVSCSVVADEMSDICSSCRLLQEPMELMID